MDTCDVAIIGAGPFGLSAASYLRQSKTMDLRVIGEPMSFWEQHMPEGMLLRSPRVASNIPDPGNQLTLDDYERATGTRISVKIPPTVTDDFIKKDIAKKVPLQDFVKYGRWFLQQMGVTLDRRTVSKLEPAPKGMQLTFEDGKTLVAGRVVVATGIGPFANIPKPFEGLPFPLVSHTSQQKDLSSFRGQEVLVVGGGQSALETAVLLNEIGARVDVLVREPVVYWWGIKRQWMHKPGISWIFYGRADVGPAGVSLLVQRPSLYRSLPRGFQDWWGVRAVRPGASSWVKARTGNVTIHTGQSVVEARPERERVRVKLNDGKELLFSRVVLGTGYRVNIDRYPFMSPQILEKIERANGFPRLDQGFESSLSGLHFVGATAAWSFGPLMRFVAGAEFASPALARRILHS